MKPFRGFTLLEIFVAGSVLIISLVGISSAIISSINLDRDSQEMMTVSLTLREKIEEIRAAAKSSATFESLYADYGPGTAKEFFKIYPNFGIIEDNTTKLKLPTGYHISESGTWKEVGRVTFVTNERVIAPNLPMLLNSGPIPDPMFNTSFSGSTDITLSPDFTSPTSFKIHYVIVSAVWQSPTTGRTRRLSFQTILGNRGI